MVLLGIFHSKSPVNQLTSLKASFKFYSQMALMQPCWSWNLKQTHFPFLGPNEPKEVRKLEKIYITIPLAFDLAFTTFMAFLTF